MMAFARVGVSMFNFYYFLFLFLLLTTFFISVAVAHRMGKGWTWRFLLIMSWSNFILHFVKQLAPSYMRLWPSVLVKSTAQNLCALLIMASPFIILWGGKWLKDYMYYVGILSALMATLVPTGPLAEDMTTIDGFLETMRYYICHVPLLIQGFLLVDMGFHKLDHRRLWAIPIMFMAAEGIIFLDTTLMNYLCHNFPWEAWLDRANGWMNAGFALGPSPSFDKALSWIYPYLVPYLQTYRNAQGELLFTPILYLSIPLYIATAIFGPLMCYPFSKNDMRMDAEMHRQLRAMKKEEKKKGKQLGIY